MCLGAALQSCSPRHAYLGVSTTKFHGVRLRGDPFLPPRDAMTGRRLSGRGKRRAGALKTPRFSVGRRHVPRRRPGDVISPRRGRALPFVVTQWPPQWPECPLAGGRSVRGCWPWVGRPKGESPLAAVEAARPSRRANALSAPRSLPCACPRGLLSAALIRASS